MQCRSDSIFDHLCSYFIGDSRHPTIFDPRVDTFDSLRERSPACFNSVLMVGSKVTDFFITFFCLIDYNIFKDT